MVTTFCEAVEAAAPLLFSALEPGLASSASPLGLEVEAANPTNLLPAFRPGQAEVTTERCQLESSHGGSVVRVLTGSIETNKFLIVCHNITFYTNWVYYFITYFKRSSF